MTSIILGLGALLLAWLVTSQIIAWMLSVDKTEDAILSMWACVFLSPILLAMIGAAFAHQALLKLAQMSGLPIEVDENPMEYLL